MNNGMVWQVIRLGRDGLAEGSASGSVSRCGMAAVAEWRDQGVGDNLGHPHALAPLLLVQARMHVEPGALGRW